MNCSCIYLAEIRSVQNRCKFVTICHRKGLTIGHAYALHPFNCACALELNMGVAQWHCKRTLSWALLRVSELAILKPWLHSNSLDVYVVQLDNVWSDIVLVLSCSVDNLMLGVQLANVLTRCSLVPTPRPIPSFSMLHAEAWERGCIIIIIKYYILLLISHYHDIVVIINYALI